MTKYNEKELKNKLTEEEYRILREKQTEKPFTGKYLHNKNNGFYNCLVCGTQLFSSSTKFDSGSGWPSFFDVVKNENVDLISDDSLGMNRVEVQCHKCKSHLGHLFSDGLNPTGKRYCINSACLNFEAK